MAALRATLTKIGEAHYRLGVLDVRGIARRGDGRDGSRINRWLVTDTRTGKLVGDYPTLARVRQYETPRASEDRLFASRRQRAIVEQSEGDWYVMLDSGTIQIVDTAERALAIVQQAARKGNKGITITAIEWRNVPSGFVPPRG